MSNIPRLNFIGIGAQKCASTWVYRVLQDHPEALVSEQKELDFFSYQYERGLQWYQQQFVARAGRTPRAVGEISPSYFHDPLSPGRALAFDPHMRILVTLRDPLERAYSNHLHDIRIGNYLGPDLSYEAGAANNPMYLEQSRYAKHLRHWLAHFDASRVLVLLQEEIQADPVTQARRVYEFLGIDPAYQSAFLFRRANESSEERIKSVDTLLKLAGQIGRRVGARALIDGIKRQSLVVRLRESNRRHLQQVIPPMSAAARDALLDALAEDLQALPPILGRADLPWPSFAAVRTPAKAAG